LSTKAGFGGNVIYAPVYRRVLWGSVEVAVYGTSRNWNFAGASREEMEINNPWITSAIQQVITEHDIRRAFAPKPAFNARVVKAEDLTKELLPAFFRGADADGVLLERSGDAYFLASSDCPCTVIYDRIKHRVLGLHCGRDALIDRGMIESKPPRPNYSVIDAELKQIPLAYADKLSVFIAAGIGPRTFDHPTTEFVPSTDGVMKMNPYAEGNRRLIKHLRETFDLNGCSLGKSLVVRDIDAGHINIDALIRVQLQNTGVLASYIDSDKHDTATDKYHDGTFMFHSNRRDKTKRNLVVVKLL
jgi:copper oxidase (laccase) domain-containing protein